MGATSQNDSQKSHIKERINFQTVPCIQGDICS